MKQYIGIILVAVSWAIGQLIGWNTAKWWFNRGKK